MYQRHERPLSDEERDHLHAQIAESREALIGGGLFACLLAVVDGLFLQVIVLLIHGRESGSTGALLGASGAVFLLHLFLVPPVILAFTSGGDRRRWRESLADGVAVVEHIEAR